MITYKYSLYILWLQSINCRLLQTKPRPTRSFGQIMLSDGSKVYLSSFKFPNKEFCYEMEKNWGGSLVLPWWFHGCHDLKIMKAKEQGNNYYLPKHKAILNSIQIYRRNQNGIFKRNDTMTTDNWARKA